MKYVDEYADPAFARRIIAEIASVATRSVRIMEVCGGQTHTILRNGIDQLLPSQVELIHGPGCPVCVTPLETIDQALAIARTPGVIFCSFGDMLRVPGSGGDLHTVRAEGGDVRVVYSPLDAVDVAAANPDREVVFFAVGFETTAPANALAVRSARDRSLGNFSILVSHVRVPPALEMIMADPGSTIDAFLAAGHVCAVMGVAEYGRLVQRHRVPVIVTGFEPIDVLDGIRRAVVQLMAGQAKLENAYERAVTTAGNTVAQSLLEDVFAPVDRAWRGIGILPDSGWRLAEVYEPFDAARRFSADVRTKEDSRCRGGEVLLGTIKPPQCSAFGTDCTPRTPLGAPMVSDEGVCAAYHRYRSFDPPADRTGDR